MQLRSLHLATSSVLAAALLLNPHAAKADTPGDNPPTPASAATSPQTSDSNSSPHQIPDRTPAADTTLPKLDASAIPPAPRPLNPLSPDFDLILTFAALTVGIVIYPIARYLKKPWAFRRDRLFGLLAGDAIIWYYKQFRPGDRIGKLPSTTVPSGSRTPDPETMCLVGDPRLTSQEYMRCFSSDFHTWYGRQYYIAPLIGLLLLSLASAWWCLNTLWNWNNGYQDTTRGLVATSLAGAFLWIISDEIDRLRRRDFTSSDVYYYVFRLLISIPFGWALTRLRLPLNTGVPLAFFLGAFPTTTLFTAARRIASEYLRLGEDPETRSLELEGLPSVGKDNAERFKDEGISTITQLAYADPIDLTIRTNFDFNYVIDCVSQALLWIYIPQSSTLNQLSLRGAQEAAALVDWLKDPDPANKAHATLAAIAAELKLPEDALFTTLYQVALDPYTQFLVNAWSQSPSAIAQASFQRSGAALRPPQPESATPTPVTAVTS